MPIGHTPQRYWLLRIFAFLVDCIAPAAVLSTLSYFFLPGWTLSLWTLWGFVETLFWGWTTWKRKEFQAVIDENVYPMLRAEERLFLFNNVMKEVARSRFTSFLSSQFMWQDTFAQLSPRDIELLRLGNLRDWFSWFLYGKPSFDALQNHSPNGRQLADEAESMMKHMLWAHGLKLEEGYNQKLRGATITHNDVEAYHKPLVLYALVSMLERSAHVLLLILGFRRHRASGQDALKGITYWLRHPKTSTALPLVFIHGLGGGLWCYIKFIGKLWYAQRHRPIYIIELPHVSYRLEKDAPEAGAFVGAVNSMLDNHGHRKAFFVGHSLGTAYQSFMNKHTTRVAGNVFIDPICFKIYDISLLYNFVHRRPGADGTEPRANEFLVHWLVAKELFVSQWISRHFIWHRVHLLPSSLLAPTHVFISEHDNLIDAPVVSQYLKECNVNHSMHKQADHAQFMLDDRKEWEILGKIGEMLDSAGREWSRKEKTGRRRRHLQGLDWM